MTAIRRRLPPAPSRKVEYATMDHKLLYYVILAPIMVATLFWGNRDHEAAMAIIAFGSILSTVFGLNQSWEVLDAKIFIIDVIALALFWGITFRTSQFWPYWITGWQLVAVMTHLQRLFFSEIYATAYAVLSMFLIYPMIAIIAISLFFGGQPIKLNRGASNEC